MNQFKTSIQWGDFNLARQQHVYLNDLLDRFTLPAATKQSVATILATLVLQQSVDVKQLPKFVCQSELSEDSRYYEQIIADLDQVPSRGASWHDFFNGLIWLQFPSTKRLLNQLHVEQIQQFGLHPRTSMRNQITHFDECGLVLVGTDRKARVIIDALQKHDWHTALWEQRDVWHNGLHPRIFGHANLEMLLEPFLSLTAKWLYIECDDPYDLNAIDTVLTEYILTNQIFVTKGMLKPLPLMGIPNWHSHQDVAFYANREVFRPLRRK